MNHSQFAAGVRNAGRGDIVSDISLEEAIQSTARVAGDFLGTHRALPEARSQAAAALKQEVLNTAGGHRGACYF